MNKLIFVLILALNTTGVIAIENRTSPAGKTGPNIIDAQSEGFGGISKYKPGLKMRIA